jgi:hypothetical protein
MIKRLAVILAALAIVLGIALPAQAAKPVSTTNQMTTVEVTSAYDGSSWLLFQAERISQPGNAVWAIQWKEADGTPCEYKSSGYFYAQLTVGETGSQTGATWGPTSYTFSYVQDGRTILASLQLAEATPNVVGHTFIGPWTGGLDEPFTYRSCDYGVLVSGQPGKPWKVLDDYVPLPWSVARTA